MERSTKHLDANLLVDLPVLLLASTSAILPVVACRTGKQSPTTIATRCSTGTAFIGPVALVAKLLDHAFLAEINQSRIEWAVGRGDRINIHTRRGQVRIMVLHLSEFAVSRRFLDAKSYGTPFW